MTEIIKIDGVPYERSCFRSDKDGNLITDYKTIHVKFSPKTHNFFQLYEHGKPILLDIQGKLITCYIISFKMLWETLDSPLKYELRIWVLENDDLYCPHCENYGMIKGPIEANGLWVQKCEICKEIVYGPIEK